MLDYLPHALLAAIACAVASLSYVLYRASARYRDWELFDAQADQPPAVQLPPLHPRVALLKPQVVVKVRDHISAPLGAARQKLGQLMPSHVSNQPPEAA